MTREHRDAVLELAPRQLRATLTLSEAARLASESDALAITDLPGLRTCLRADEVHDVPDPIGQSPDFFADVGGYIADLLNPVIRLCRENPHLT